MFVNVINVIDLGVQEWPDNPPISTIKRFIQTHIVDKKVSLFNSLVIQNSELGVQKLRCFTGTHQFGGAKIQDVICAIPSKVPPAERSKWSWNPRGHDVSESFEVARLVKLFKIRVNPSTSTGMDIRELSLAYVSWMDR